MKWFALFAAVNRAEFVEAGQRSLSRLFESSLWPFVGLGAVVVVFFIWLHWRDWRRARAYRDWENQQRKPKR